jgi:hypothetical protein
MIRKEHVRTKVKMPRPRSGVELWKGLKSCGG